MLGICQRNDDRLLIRDTMRQLGWCRVCKQQLAGLSSHHPPRVARCECMPTTSRSSACLAGFPKGVIHRLHTGQQLLWRVRQQLQHTHALQAENATSRAATNGPAVRRMKSRMRLQCLQGQPSQRQLQSTTASPPAEPTTAQPKAQHCCSMRCCALRAAAMEASGAAGVARAADAAAGAHLG